MYFTKGWKSTVQNLERFCSDTSKKSAQRVGRVLTSLIKKRYPKGKDSVSFDELLDWGLWSSYIRMYCTCKQMFHTGVSLHGWNDLYGTMYMCESFCQHLYYKECMHVQCK